MIFSFFIIFIIINISAESIGGFDDKPVVDAGKKKIRRNYDMLKGKTAIITGGTRGIGFAIAKVYLENGANVAITGSRQESVEKALAKLPEYAEHIMGIWPNLCDPAEVADAAASVKEKFGSIDILVNNAGISSRTDRKSVV